ncbi:hypothetical protein HK098_003138 [Nowakowskiella sp. JEL0407]|nr:hypothetical protein HK098_003138 [Nowakowskiella sp. JEL0407]
MSSLGLSFSANNNSNFSSNYRLDSSERATSPRSTPKTPTIKIKTRKLSSDVNSDNETVKSPQFRTPQSQYTRANSGDEQNELPAESNSSFITEYYAASSTDSDGGGQETPYHPTNSGTRPIPTHSYSVSTATSHNAPISLLRPSNASPIAPSSFANITPSKESVIKMINESLGKHDLNLSQKRMKVLPAEIGTATSLERLGLSHNSFTSLPNEIAKLTQLRYINLRSNSLLEFPAVLCQLPNLKVLGLICDLVTHDVIFKSTLSKDLGKNKIRKMPATFGTLMNLEVLSLAKNLITEIPTYVGYMIDLKVLLIEQNPIEWPPVEIFDGYSRPIPEVSDSNEKWVLQLKDFLRKDGPVRDARLQPAACAVGDSMANGKGADMQLRECDDLVDFYMSNKPITTPWMLEGDDSVLFEVAQSVSWSFGRLYRAVKQLLAALPLTDRERMIPRTFDKELYEFNRRVVDLIAALIEFTPPNALATESESEAATSNSQFPSLSVVVAMAKSRWHSADQPRNGAEVPADVQLKQNVHAAAMVSKRLMIAINTHLRKLVERADIRVSRALLLEWHGISAELVSALQTLGIMPSAINSPPSQTIVHSPSMVLDSIANGVLNVGKGPGNGIQVEKVDMPGDIIPNSEPESMANRAETTNTKTQESTNNNNQTGSVLQSSSTTLQMFYSSAETATSAAYGLLSLLGDYPQRLRDRQLDRKVQNEGENYGKDVEQLLAEQYAQADELRIKLREVEVSTERFAKSLSSLQLSDKGITSTLFREANGFVTAVIGLSTLMRTILSNFVLPEDVRSALPTLTRSTRELVKNLTAYR